MWNYLHISNQALYVEKPLLLISLVQKMPKIHSVTKLSKLSQIIISSDMKAHSRNGHRKQVCIYSQWINSNRDNEFESSFNRCLMSLPFNQASEANYNAFVKQRKKRVVQIVQFSLFTKLPTADQICFSLSLSSQINVGQSLFWIGSSVPQFLASFTKNK